MAIDSPGMTSGLNCLSPTLHPPHQRGVIETTE